jgi:hypothetical protein
MSHASVAATLEALFDVKAQYVVSLAHESGSTVVPAKAGT